MKNPKNNFLNSIYLFASRRRWIRKLLFFKLPDIGFYRTKSDFIYAVELNDWKGPSYHLIKWGEETYEAENKESLLAFLPDTNGIFIDVGANIGLFSFYCKKRKKQLKAYLFEPEPIANKCLKNTITWNNIDDFRVFDLALSDKESSALLFIDGKNCGGNSLIENSIISEGNYIKTKIPVKTSTLDSFIKEQNLEAIHCIKIDVQGHEYEVLSGGLKSLKKFKPILLIEFFFKELSSENNILKQIELIHEGKNFLIFEPRNWLIYTVPELYEYAATQSKKNPLSFSEFLFVPENERNIKIFKSLQAKKFSFSSAY